MQNRWLRILQTIHEHISSKPWAGTTCRCWAPWYSIEISHCLESFHRNWGSHRSSLGRSRCSRNSERPWVHVWSTKPRFSMVYHAWFPPKAFGAPWQWISFWTAAQAVEWQRAAEDVSAGSLRTWGVNRFNACVAWWIGACYRKASKSAS